MDREKSESISQSRISGLISDRLKFVIRALVNEGLSIVFTRCVSVVLLPAFLIRSGSDWEGKREYETNGKKRNRRKFLDRIFLLLFLFLPCFSVCSVLSLSPR